jgi:hypothetical protein
VTGVWKALAVASKELRQIRRDRRTLLILLFVPAFFLLDGKPATDLEVEIIAGGTRYRDAPEEMTFKTNKDGEIAVTWPAAGLYWLELSVQDEKATVPGVKKRRASYSGTFEVLTQ